MNHILGMEILHPFKHLVKILHRLFLCETLMLADVLEQISLLGEFHEQKYSIAHFKVVVQSNYVFVFELLVQLDLSLHQFQLSIKMHSVASELTFFSLLKR